MTKLSRRFLLGGGALLTLAAAREYYLLSSLKGPEPLTVLNGLDAVFPGQLSVKKIVDGAAYGPNPRQRLDVYAPEGDVTNAPIMVFFYGGGWTKGDRGDHAFVGRALASRGFVVVVPDYRLTPQIAYPEFVRDGASAVDWAVRHAGEIGGNAGRLAVAGHSAGAYIAAMLALNRDFGATSQIGALVGISGGRYRLLPRVRAKERATFAAISADQSVQPIDFVRPDAPPTLLLTGSIDDVADPQITYDFAAALKRAGASVTVKTYSGVEHKDMLAAFAAPYRWNIPVLDDVSTFLHTLWK